jgi:hypothetical protein
MNRRSVESARDCMSDCRCKLLPETSGKRLRCRAFPEKGVSPDFGFRQGLYRTYRTYRTGVIDGTPFAMLSTCKKQIRKTVLADGLYCAPDCSRVAPLLSGQMAADWSSAGQNLSNTRHAANKYWRHQPWMLPSKLGHAGAFAGGLLRWPTVWYSRLRCPDSSMRSMPVPGPRYGLCNTGVSVNGGAAVANGCVYLGQRI